MKDFELNPKWWADNKPKVMKASGLGKALTAFVAKEKEFKSAIAKAGGGSPQTVGEGPYKAFKAAFEALETVDDCRKKAIKNVGRLRKDLVAALNKDAPIVQRKKLLRAAMATGIQKDVKKLIAYHDDLVKEIDLIKVRMKNLLEIKKRADNGDEKARKVFGKGVRNANDSAMKVGSGPDRLKLAAVDLFKYLEKLPGDFSGHQAAAKGMAKAAIKLDKDKKVVIKFTNDYKDATAND